jgi:hypothetical protein
MECKAMAHSPRLLVANHALSECERGSRYFMQPLFYGILAGSRPLPTSVSCQHPESGVG